MRRVLTLAAFALIAACGDSSEGQRGAGGSSHGAGFGGGRPPTLVVVEQAQRRSISDVVEAIGTARANESVTITAKVTDTISQVRFEDGDFVDKGDVLVELTNEEQTALLAEAEANANDALAQRNRFEDLLEQQSVPVSQVDEARARYSAARARYQAILARLDDRLIRAPFRGLLGFRQVSAGTLITPGTAITTLDDVSVIKLDFSIPEIYLGLVRPGLALTAFSAAYPDRQFQATVRTVGSRIDPVTRAVTVRAHIANDEKSIRPGMLMTVRLETSSREAVMVPETALVQRAAETFVYTLGEQNRAVATPVRHGTRREGWVEITEGLAPGTAVVTEGVIKVRPGAPVRVRGEGVAGGPPRRPGEQVQPPRSGPPTAAKEDL